MGELMEEDGKKLNTVLVKTDLLKTWVYLHHFKEVLLSKSDFDLDRDIFCRLSTLIKAAVEFKKHDDYILEMEDEDIEMAYNNCLNNLKMLNFENVHLKNYTFIDTETSKIFIQRLKENNKSIKYLVSKYCEENKKQNEFLKECTEKIDKIEQDFLKSLIILNGAIKMKYH